MTSRRAVEREIRRAERLYDEAWAGLVAIKRGSGEQPFGELFRQIQPSLAEALFHLSRLHRSIAWKIKQLRKIPGRTRTTASIRRLDTLIRYRNAVAACENVGLALGDTLAWFFYRREAALLRKHHEHPGQARFPAGRGGLGEVAFIQNLQGWSGHLALLHGVTTFLKVGDVSFINVETMKVVALGEIKTIESDDERCRIQLHFIADQTSAFIDSVTTGLSFGASQNAEQDAVALPEEMRTRLNRQLSRMQTTLEDGRPKDQPVNNLLLDGSYFPLVESRAASVKRGSWKVEKLSDSFILAIVRSRSRSLVASLLRTSGAPDELTSELRDALSELPDSNHWAGKPALGTIVFSREGPPHHPMIAPPLFWFATNDAIVYELIFGRSVLFSIVRPARLVRELAARGLEITPSKKPGRFAARIPSSSQDFEIGGLRSAIDLIRYGCMTESNVAEMFTQSLLPAVAKAVERGHAGRVHVSIDLSVLLPGEEPPE